MAVGLTCAGWLAQGHAQNPPGTSRTTLEDRNLLVQATPAPAANAAVRSQQRVALVIGNSAYKDAPLSNPVNDARAIAKALQESGFSVIVRENIDQRGLLLALREFGDRLRAGGTGLFYYAGHGMQIKGRNYLIPVGAAVEREDEVAYSAVDAQAVLDKMEAAGNVANIMILDACRNNPFTRSSRSGQAGLAQMDAPVGTLVSFATSPGAVASDGAGQNGLFTQHLLAAMRQPGYKVEEVFKQVRANVRRDSLGRQVPWESTSLEGDFYFLPPQAAPVSSPPDTSGVVEAALWDAVKNSTEPGELRIYLRRYPDGKYAAEAQAQLAKVRNATKTGAPKVQGTVANGPTAPNPAAVAPAAALAAMPPAVPLAVSPVRPAATQPASTRPAPLRNANGFTTGDRWRYQRVDKYKGEVVANFEQRVDRFLPDGTVVAGRQRWSPEGNTRSYSDATYASREYSDHDHMLPRELRVGYREDFSFNDVARRANGFEHLQAWQGTLVVKGKERIRVPAGEFEALRIEREATINGTQTNGSDRWYSRSVMTLWYVPELRRYVAWDEEYRRRSGPPDRSRVELTSFEVAGASVAQK